MSSGRDIQRVLAAVYRDEIDAGAEGLIWAGSTRDGSATSSSDVDVVIVYRNLAASFRRLRRVDGVLLEILGHTPESLERHISREVASRRPGLLHMIATGEAMFSVGPAFAAIQAGAAQVLADGPAPLTPGELDYWRYRLTVEADDLQDNLDPAVTVMLAGSLLDACLQFTQLTNRRWLGSPKWMLRDLDSLDPAVASRARSVAGSVQHGDLAPLLSFAFELLAVSGGRADDGYVRISSFA